MPVTVTCLFCFFPPPPKVNDGDVLRQPPCSTARRRVVPAYEDPLAIGGACELLLRKLALPKAKSFFLLFSFSSNFGALTPEILEEGLAPSLLKRFPCFFFCDRFASF